MSDPAPDWPLVMRWANPVLAVICFLLAICCFLAASNLGCRCVGQAIPAKGEKTPADQ
jgi:hypothetical protein